MGNIIWCPSSLAKVVYSSNNLVYGRYNYLMGVTNQQTSLGGHHLVCIVFFLKIAWILTSMKGRYFWPMDVFMMDICTTVTGSLDPGSMSYHHPSHGNQWPSWFIYPKFWPWHFHIKMSPPFMDLRQKAPQKKNVSEGSTVPDHLMSISDEKIHV